MEKFLIHPDQQVRTRDQPFTKIHKKEDERVIKGLLTKRSPDPDEFEAGFYQTSKKI